MGVAVVAVPVIVLFGRLIHNRRISGALLQPQAADPTPQGVGPLPPGV